MKVYRHEPKGARFFVLLLFSAVLLVLNGMILTSHEPLPVIIFTLVFTLGWLAVTADSLTARVVVDEKGIGVFSILFKKLTGWSEITEINFGDRWVLGSFMPEHVVITYQTDQGSKAGTMTLHNDIKNWKALLTDIVDHAPSHIVPSAVRSKI